MTDEEHDFEERAAIHEFDGGLPRAEAEQLARAARPAAGPPADPHARPESAR